MTAEKSKASAVRKALVGFIRLHELRELADTLGTVEMQFTNDQIEAMEDAPC